MKTIDTRGKLCPMPLIIFKRDIKTAQNGEEVEILVDNDMACQNLRDHLNDMGVKFNQEDKDGISYLRFTFYGMSEDTKHHTNISNNYIIILNADTLGKGNEDLGRILMKAFVNTIENLEVLPAKILCYNSGVKLLIEGTDTASTLKKLNETKGIDIFACGTCIDFYELKGKLTNHKVANMLNILEEQSKAAKVIYP